MVSAAFKRRLRRPNLVVVGVPTRNEYGDMLACYDPNPLHHQSWHAPHSLPVDATLMVRIGLDDETR